jgi:cytochrome c oxidase subunit 4
MTHTSESAAHAHAHTHPHVNYLLIFGALCAFTLLSVIFDNIALTKPVIAVLVLAVAAAKALFVMMFFMHLKFEGNWKFVLLMPTFILACGLPLALAPDVGLHYYPQQVPQVQGASHAAPAGDTETDPPPGHAH